MKRRFTAVIPTASACLALAAGCGAMHGTGATQGGGATQASGPAQASGAASTGAAGTGSAAAGTVTASESPQQQAEAAARQILQAFAPPPGAVRQAAEPSSARQSLDAPAGYVAGYEIRQTSWWLAPGQPAAIIAWESAHLPKTFTATSTGAVSSGPVTTVMSQFYEIQPVVPRGLVAEYLIVSVAGLGGGKTAIRADAEVSYQPARPAGEQVPATATAVTITAVSGYQGATAPRPVTITTLPVVRKLAAIVNSLPLSTAPQDAPCPMIPGIVVRLTFRATATGGPLAVAEGPEPCDALALTVAGKEWPLLGLAGPFSTQVLEIAGLHWSAAPF
jgi:hypothetical protein